MDAILSGLSTLGTAERLALAAAFRRASAGPQYWVSLVGGRHARGGPGRGVDGGPPRRACATTCCRTATARMRLRWPLDTPLLRSQESGLAWPHGRDRDGRRGRLRRAAPLGGGGAHRKAQRRPASGARCRPYGRAQRPADRPAPVRERSGPARAAAAGHGRRGLAAARHGAGGAGEGARGGAPRGARRRSGAVDRRAALDEGGPRGRDRAFARRTRGRVAAVGRGRSTNARCGADGRKLRRWPGLEVRFGGSGPASRSAAGHPRLAGPDHRTGLNGGDASVTIPGRGAVGLGPRAAFAGRQPPLPPRPSEPAGGAWRLPGVPSGRYLPRPSAR